MTGEVDLLGKKPADLQTNISINGNSITGTLKYVSGYTGFNGSVVEEQEGNYLALKFNSEPNDTEITVEIVGGKKGAVELDEDRMFVGRITDKNSQSIKVVCKKDSKVITETYDLKGLILQPNLAARAKENRR